jgi:WD40 repeat protein
LRPAAENARTPSRPAVESSEPAHPVIPGYEVIRRLGRGGMGLVYLTREVALNRLVALKVVTGGVFADAEVLDRFRLEAEAIASLRHPNIVQIFRVGATNGGDVSAPPSPYIALEYADGGTLAAHVGRPIPPRSAARVIGVLARAVHFAHERGIIHRDLKPGNILLHGRDPVAGGGDPLDRFEPKLTDFGVAKRPAANASLTIAGAMLGTPEYMSPEQAAGRPNIGPATDVYALGVMLYALLTGHVPFRGADAVDTLQSVRLTEPVPPNRLQTRLHRDLNTICLRCLEKEPSHRYRSAEALAMELEAWLDGRPIAARPVGKAERAIKWARRRPTVAALLAAVLVLATAGGAGVTWQWRRAEARAEAEKTARETAQDIAYFSQVNLAHREVAAGRIPDAVRLLDACVPAAGQPDRRGWEWHYLRNQCRQELFSFQASRQWVWDLDVSPDGTEVVTATGTPYEAATTPGELTVWDIATGQARRRFVGHTGAIRKVKFSPDGRRICSAGADGTARIWDAATGQPIGHPVPCRVDRHLIVALHGSAGPVIFARMGRGIEVCGPNGWFQYDPDKDRMAPCPELNYFFGESPDGRFVLTCTDEGEIRILDRVAGSTAGPYRARSGTFLGAVSPDGKSVVLTNYHQAELWDVAAGRQTVVFDSPTSWIQAVVIDPGGRRAAAAAGNQVYVYRFDKPKPVVFSGHADDVRCVAFTPDGRRLVSGDRGGRVCVWDLAREPYQDVVDGGVHSSLQYGYALDRTGEHTLAVILGSALRRINIATRQLETIKLAGMTKASRFPRNDVQFSADGAFIFAPRDEDPRLVGQWSSADGQIVRDFAGHELAVSGVAVSGDGRRLATRSGRKSTDDPSPGEVIVWDAADGRFLRRVATEPVCGLALSHEGSRLAGTNYAGEVIVWDTADGREVWRVAAHPVVERTDRVLVFGLAFSPDARWVGSAGWHDGLVRVWDATNGRPAWPAQPGGPSLTGLTFTPDSRRVLAAGYDSEVRMWDVASGQLALILRPPAISRLGDIAYTARPVFSQINQRLLLLDHVGQLNCWDGRTSP